MSEHICQIKDGFCVYRIGSSVITLPMSVVAGGTKKTEPDAAKKEESAKKAVR